MKSNGALRFMAQTAKKEIVKLIALTLTNTVASFLGVYFALAMRDVINLAVAKDSAMYRAIWIFIGVVVGQIVFYVITQLLATHVTARLEISFREKVFREILRKDYSEISKFHSGEVQNRLFNDVNVVSENVATLIPNVVGLLTRLIGALCAILIVDTRFAFIMLIGGAVLFLFARLFRGIMKSTHKDVQEASGKLRSFIQEACENILVIKAFKMEDKIGDTADEKSEVHYGKKMYRAFFSTGASTGFRVLVFASYVYAVIWGATRIISGAVGFGYGDFTAIIELISQIQSPFASLSGSLSRYYSAIASTERLMELCNLESDTEAEVGDIPALYDKISSISLENITFAYGKNVVLSGADAEIEKGKLTLISGISGIGKSTLIKLLMGVLRPEEGSISAKTPDGKINIDASTRGLFAYVPQGNLLMSGTVRDNMLLAKADATDEEIFAALSCACADFTEELDSKIGERGSGFSEGQVQRLAIARAVLCGAPILLLDEATSALDEATEKRVLENIMKLKGKTCVAISHRNAARSVCDAEIYIENTKIKKKLGL